METTPHGRGETPTFVARADRSVGGLALERFLEHVPTAFFLTRGPDHVLVSANGAGRRLLASRGSAVPGHPLRETLGDAGALTALLDLAFHTGVVIRDGGVALVHPDSTAWCCSIWPQADLGGGPAHLMVELRPRLAPAPGLALQRSVAERLLLSALREHDVAEAAESARHRAVFLAAEGERLTGTLDPALTERAVARSALPYAGSWCIVDLVTDDGAMHRLAIVHPDPAKQSLAATLADEWAPQPGEAFGAPAMLRDARATVAAPEPDGAQAAHAGASTVRRAMDELGVGTLLTVPLVIGGRLGGALTFVSAERDHVYSSEDIELAQALAQRGAMALESARQYAELMALRERAERENSAKSAFIGTLSHEIRTPLTAIAGYVDLIDMGLRGPVSDQQRADLARIRLSQQHLVAVITNVLSLLRAGEGVTEYHVAPLSASDAVAMVVDMLEPLIRQRDLALAVGPSDSTAVAEADPEKVTQILVNLVANAIKFSAPGGRLAIDVDGTAHSVRVHVSDTGIGIAPEDCGCIFEPFVQTRDGRHARGGGVGLGLAISRALARGMGGDLTVESERGVGSRFTLTLPRAD